MAEDLVVNGNTYSGVEAVVMKSSVGEDIPYYPDAVRYIEQTLTDAQQAQARSNIDALGSADLSEAVNDALAKAKASGEFDGADGISPTITVGKYDKIAVIQITDVNGTDYVTILDGAPGNDGADGNGIKSAVLNEDYTLTLTFDDGTSYTTPSIRGATGADGQNGISSEVILSHDTEPDGRNSVGIASTITLPNGDKHLTFEKVVDGKDGVSPVVSVSAITGGNRITITDAEGTKTVDIMNGSDGTSGRNGNDGNGIKSAVLNADDTLTLTFDDGTSYTTPSIRGATGAAGKDGAQGNPGKDGVSATHSWNGTTLTITSASGTSSANLKGEKGDKGDQGIQGEKGDTGAQGPKGDKGDKGDTGAAGKTPVKGTDYWTEGDRAELVSEVMDSGVLMYTTQTLTEAQKAQARANIGATAGEDVEFADSLEWLNENGDTGKKYVLPDGYLYAWMDKTVSVEHNANDGTGYLNCLPQSTWGNTQYGTYDGLWISPLISIDPTKIAPVGNPTESRVVISGIEKAVPAYNSRSMIVWYYKQDGSQMFMKAGADLASIGTNDEITLPKTINLKDTNIFADSNWAQVYGVRIGVGVSTSAITQEDVKNLKVNMPALNYEKSGYDWYSTGQQHSNDKATQQNSADIATLREEVDELKNAVSTSPSNSGAKWFAIGDSITYGLYSTSFENYYQPVAGQRWVDYVAKHNGYALTNLGKSNAGFLTSPTFRSMVDGADFGEADLVTIMLGINDWKYDGAVNKVGTMDDDISTGGTIVSELRYGIEKIIADNPYCKIILITPINAKIGGRGTEATNWAYGFTGTITPCGSLKNFGDKLKEVCEYYGIQVIDMTNSSVVNRKSITTVLPDGIHPNLACYKALGLELARKITFA